MKKTIYSLAFLLVGALTLHAAGNVFSTIRAESEGEEISIRWTTGDETGIHTFDIERKSTEVPTFRRIGQITARGEGSSYTFVDNGAFFKPNADKQFTYRLKGVGTGTVRYSPSVTVTHEVVSSVKRSWGMIKELFR